MTIDAHMNAYIFMLRKIT
uniref:Uncharacterized protein n=1 Tax=Rhizophora mucronata TaxID=61149 RepID=A0A2P2P6N3_RHIMU